MESTAIATGSSVFNSKQLMKKGIMSAKYNTPGIKMLSPNQIQNMNMNVSEAGKQQRSFLKVSLSFS